jgi:hypothetical protein
MKVISFDVGIKNLAYCLFETTDARPHIADWKVLSLLGDEQPIHKCSHITTKTAKKITTQTPCSRLAKYRQTECFFCDKHAKAQTEWLMPEPRFKTIKKMKLEELVAIAKEFGLDTAGKKPDILKNVETHLAEKCLTSVKYKTQSAGEADLVSLGQAMKRVFKDILPEDISVVLIENQISPLANRMKTVQGMLAQYFIMRYENIRIEFISSANKLKMFTKDKKETKEKESKENQNVSNQDETKEQTQSQKYKEHKNDGLYHCSMFLDNNPVLNQWKHVLDTKKKDDYADCFLQCIWHCSKMKWICIVFLDGNYILS